MKIRSTFILAGIAIVVLTYSCAKDSLENTFPNNTGSNGSLNAFLTQITPPVQTFTLDASTGGTITASRGTILYLGPWAFLYQNGFTVQGNVTIEIMEVFNKKEMIGSGAFTTAGGIPIESGGEVKITARQGSEELELTTACVAWIKIPAGSNPDYGMDPFFADEITAGQDFELEDSSNVTVTLDSTAAGPTYYYYTFPEGMGWTNVDQYMSGATTLTPYSVSLPGIFNSANTSVYISLNDYNSIASMYSFDAATNAFNSGGYYQLPVGFDVTFIAISEINGQFYYAEQQMVVGSTCDISLIPQPCSEAFVDQKLNAL